MSTNADASAHTLRTIADRLSLTFFGAFFFLGAAFFFLGAAW